MLLGLIPAVCCQIKIKRAAEMGISPKADYGIGMEKVMRAGDVPEFNLVTGPSGGIGDEKRAFLFRAIDRKTKELSDRQVRAPLRLGHGQAPCPLSFSADGHPKDRRRCGRQYRRCRKRPQ
jgi:hypothetical protein